MITIFTPTYNRAYTLERLFQSIERQPFHDAEWIIVDDGSTDHTHELVESWAKDYALDIPIRYIGQQNSGKHVAWNIGLAAAKGDVFFPVDSDDYLTDNALESIQRMVSTVNSDEKIIAVSGVRMFPGNKTTGGILDSLNGGFIDYSSISRRSEGITGDLAEAFFTDKLRKYPFPVYPDERFVPEAVIFNRFSNDGYLIRGFADPLYNCEYLEDGYTRNTNRLLITNWKGYCLYVKELMASSVNIKAKFIPLGGFIYRSILKLFRRY